MKTIAVKTKTTAMMYNEEMMRAHLREIAAPGTGKRMTRRVVKARDGIQQCQECCLIYSAAGHGATCPLCRAIQPCPYGRPGDLLWFRESMKVIGTGAGSVKIRYEADRYTSGILPWPTRLKERPVVGHCLSNGGPREFSRMTGLITNVRVERLQDISRADAAAEGLCYPDGYERPAWLRRDRWPEENFGAVWQAIYGHASWHANPWVWVIEYQPMLVNVDEYLREEA